MKGRRSATQCLVGLLVLVAMTVVLGCSQATPAAPTAAAPSAKPAIQPTTAPTVVPQSQPSAPVAKPEQQVREVHFYNYNALTGASAPYGTRAAHGAELAAKAINDAGGFTDSQGNRYKIKLTMFDVGDSRDQAVSGLRKAAEDPTVLAAIGPTPSVSFLAALPVAEQMKLVMTAMGSGAAVSKWNAYAFRNSATSVGAVPVLLKTLSGLGLKKMAIIYDNTNDAMVGELAEIRTNAAKFGYEVVAAEAMRAGDVDFRPQLTKIKAANPDSLGVYCTLDDMVKVVQQTSDLGFLNQVQLVTGYAMFDDPKAWELSGGKIKGAIDWSMGLDLTSKDPQVSKFVADYKAIFPEDPIYVSVASYQVTMAYVDAVKRAGTGTDREKFRDAVGNTAFDTLLGRVTWNSARQQPNGENLTPPIMVSRVKGAGAMDKLN